VFFTAQSSVTCKLLPSDCARIMSTVRPMPGTFAAASYTVTSAVLVPGGMMPPLGK